MSSKIKIMGILNVTPDSFYDGGKFSDVKKAIDRAYQIKDEGADILDIGGESTRPGSETVSQQEEMDRICPVIEAVAGDIGIPISADTYKNEVAAAALESGASMINDISGLAFDHGIADTVADHNAGIVLMHIKGTPDTMQDNPVYDDLIGEISSYLKNAREKALKAGISAEKIILDPGIGFGKTLEDNYSIIKHLNSFKDLGSPILIGLSRKSLIGKLYEGDTDRLPATIALNTVSILNGADIIRVHDVKEHKLALTSYDIYERVS